MTENAVTILLEKLVPFLENEVQLLSGGREEVVNMRGELERIRAFLRIADALEESDHEVKVWVNQIRDVAHDARDVLDEYTILLAHNHGDGVYGILHMFSCCIRNWKARYRVCSEIKGINSRIKNICKGHQRLRHRFVAEQGSRSNGAGNMWQDRRGDALLLDKADLVGIDEPKMLLVGWLVKGSLGREVVSVVGLGGLGKTTLVKQVYDDTEVKKCFMAHAWITVSQSSKIEELLKDMVQQLVRVTNKPVPQGVDSMNGDRLKTIIKGLLQKRRYLIVLDDVWHINEWDAIKYALPNNNCGSRVVLTTRNTDPASTSCIESNGKVYNLEPLPAEESWTLFCRKTFQGNQCPSYLKEICENILRKCQGLPLAIVAISGVLATKDKRRIDEWDMVCRGLGAEIEGNDKLQNLRKVLSLSFNDLPCHLKSCFLYLSIFPEDHLIEKTRLIRLWIAEGFVEEKEGKSLEEVAEDYHNELLNRSLMQVAGTTGDGRVKTCRIHDLLREIIISKSRDQNFALIAKEQNASWPDKVRRLSIHNTLRNVQGNRSVAQLRSLFMFGVEEKLSLYKLFPEGFRLLSVLDLQAASLKRFPVDVVNLYYLKYLSLKGTKVKTLPRYIGKLQNLETLDLKHTRVTDLPVEILNLQRLRHLLVYYYDFKSFHFFHYKSGFKALSGIGGLQALQRLCFIEVDQDSGMIIKELGNLHQLRRLGILKLRREDGFALCLTIAKLRNLRALSVTAVEEDEIIDLQHLCCPPQFLERLYISGRLKKLPNWILSLQSLVKLFLKWSWLQEDPLLLLQGLPNLAHLDLLEVYGGDTLCFKAGGYKKLKLLGLDKFDDLRQVKVEEGAMPCLEKLIIQRCEVLETLPSGIEHLTKLKVLGFYNMPDKFMKAVGTDEQGEGYRNIAHVPEVYFNYWRDGGWDVYPLERSSKKEGSPRQGIVMRSHEHPPSWK